MSLQELFIQDFRCIKHTKLEFSPTVNLIVGGNGSGKTSCLEAIYFLGNAKSFRTSDKRVLVKEKSPQCLVRASLLKKNASHSQTLGLAYSSKSGIEGRYQGQTVKSVAQLSRLLPIQLIEPKMHLFFDGGPLVRRKVMDWGVFHVEHQFLSEWQKYRSAMKQRNAALRSHQPSSAKHWDRQYIEHAQNIDKYRRAYVEELNTVYQSLVADLLPEAETIKSKLSYKPGWKDDLYVALQACMQKDIQNGVCHQGPHRADLQVLWGNRKAEQVISRGQQKLLACAVLLAQVNVVAKRLDQRVALLVDDLTSELDQQHAQKLLAVLLKTPAQIFLTCLSSDAFINNMPSDLAVFHVEQGCLKKVVQ